MQLLILKKSYWLVGFFILFFIIGAVLPAQASTYIGDFCWQKDNGEWIVLSVSLIGVDSRGYENYIYAGKYIVPGSGLIFPLSGNCTEYNGLYKCAMLMTGVLGNAATEVVLNVSDLNGIQSGIYESYNSTTQMFTKDFRTNNLFFVGSNFGCPNW